MNLPDNWLLTSLDEIAAQEKGAIRRGPFGGSLKKDIFVSQGYKVYEQQNAIKNNFDIGNYYIDDKKYKEMIGFNVYPDDLIISCAGTIGRVAIVPHNAQKGIINQALMRLRLNLSVVVPLYLKLYLESPLAKKEIFDQSVGTALKNLAAVSEIKKSQIPIPPLNEQRRIVDKLDRIGDRHRTARNELNHIPKLIARYKQAILAAACSGKLTEDWRIKHNLENSWQSTTLGEVIVDKPKNGYSAKPVPYETPFRVLTLTATTSGKFNAKHFKYFDESIEINSQFWLQPNDILIQRGNTIEYVGVPAIYDGLPNQFIFPDLMMRLRVKETVITQFLYFLLSCENSRQYLRDRATGTAGSMPKINQPTLISLPIELPSLEEQKEIVRRVEKMFEKIDRMEEEYQKATKLCDRLEQATLAKAFRGELVPQDPHDEPASVLLEQIKKEKDKGKKVKTHK
ncbi:restriction endonuclease subunit S [Pseudanabaena sp. FACHB-1998]|uniref:restriction endonuclease subunit S n=1 Tax=Pseudanabaena sp. FACHB-1998 TaxID=2692858 RepID=UPI00168057F7|nr:restriction endonuclease subunit S [Pseudanabaena sp. FACHB-1998]MBD2176552.1 restriction endonuclease subunit S [Pseudanabaena sp. FACHB-1998]